MDIANMNPLDLALLALTLIAVVTGFSAGLLRSLATILAYLIATPIALAVSPRLTKYLVPPADSDQLVPSVHMRFQDTGEC